MDISSAAAGEISPKNRFADLPTNDDFSIVLDWSSYTPAEHDRWNRLYARCIETLKSRACPEYLEAITKLNLGGNGIPDMSRLSDELEKYNGWRVVPVAGIVPDYAFFDHLANKQFPAGAFIRPEHELDYLEEPDIFHDIFGHIPLLTNPAYAEFSQAYGKARKRAIEYDCLENLITLYWFTIEFGLVRSGDDLKLFGAGMMSSAAEAKFALEDPSPNRIAFDLERSMRTKALIDDFQQTYFVIDSFEALLAACAQDFGPIYERVAGKDLYQPHEILPSDEIIHRGTRAYFLDKQKAALAR